MFSNNFKKNFLLVFITNQQYAVTFFYYWGLFLGNLAMLTLILFLPKIIFRI